MLKIQRLKLINFAPIKKAIGLNEIELNRENSNNTILLLLGANGSGKTTILTEATPSVLEHLKGRTQSRILPGKVGKKEIDILKDFKILYKIEIIYDKTTKCFIHKYNKFTNEDLGELNPNGNVKTYYD
jgi:predicted ATP-binding protein involved in virulence